MPDYTPKRSDWLRAICPRFTNVIRQSIVRRPNRLTKAFGMEITKALAALRPLYGKANIEIVTEDGHRVRGIVRSMKTTQALTTPSVKVERVVRAWVVFMLRTMPRT